MPGQTHDTSYGTVDESYHIDLPDGFSVDIYLYDYGDRINEPGRWWKYYVSIKDSGAEVVQEYGPSGGYFGSADEALDVAAEVGIDALRRLQVALDPYEIREQLRGLRR